MVHDIFKKKQEQDIVEAQQLVSDNYYDEYKQLFKGRTFEELNGYYGDNVIRTDLQHKYHEFYNNLAKKISQDINVSNADDFFSTFFEAQNKLFHCMLVVLDKKPEDADKSWFTQYLVGTRLESHVQSMASQYGNPLVHKLSRHISGLSDLRGKLERRFFNAELDHVYSTSFIFGNDKNIEFKDIFKKFVNKGSQSELASFALHAVKQLDGRYAKYQLNAIDLILVSEVMNYAYNRIDIGPDNISKLIDEGVIQQKSLWDTEFFNNHISPVVTEESMSKFGEEFKRQMSSQPIYSEIKNSLSREEKLNFFINSSMHTLQSWERGMNLYAIDTGEILTFNEARKLDPKHGFNLSNTQAYSDFHDQNMNPDEFRTIKLDSNKLTKSEAGSHYDGLKAFSTYVSCKSLSIEKVREAFYESIKNIAGIEETVDGYNGVALTTGVEGSLTKSYISEFESKILKALEAVNAKAILPGDVVKAIHGEDCELQDYGIKNNSKHLVTDVDLFNGIKIKGMPHYFNEENFILSKKRKLGPLVEMSL